MRHHAAEADQDQPRQGCRRRPVHVAVIEGGDQTKANCISVSQNMMVKIDWRRSAFWWQYWWRQSTSRHWQPPERRG